MLYPEDEVALTENAIESPAERWSKGVMIVSTVACLGTAGETAESYSIALMNGEENIGNYTVEPMILGDMKSYTCSWTPRAAGEASIYALLTLDDVVTSTDTITVSVAEESLISTVMIGDLSTTAPSPNYKHYRLCYKSSSIWWRSFE